MADEEQRLAGARASPRCAAGSGGRTPRRPPPALRRPAGRRGRCAPPPRSPGARTCPTSSVLTGSSMKSSRPENSTMSSKRALDLAPREAEHRAVDEDVLAARDLGVEAGAELDQRRRPGRRPATGRLVGLRMPATSLSRVDLPEPLPPMTPKASPRATSKDTPRAPRSPRRPQAAGQRALEERALQRAQPVARQPSAGSAWRPARRGSPSARSAAARSHRLHQGVAQPVEEPRAERPGDDAHARPSAARDADRRDHAEEEHSW